MPWPFTFQHGFSKQKSHYMFQQPLHFANWLQSKICTELFLIPMHPSEKLPFVTENSFISCKEYFTYRLLPHIFCLLLNIPNICIFRKCQDPNQIYNSFYLSLNSKALIYICKPNPSQLQKRSKETEFLKSILIQSLYNNTYPYLWKYISHHS